ncbi:MAG: GGDEF domain-containing protein [Actinobacteria bacterium]|nr:GGDEF domain-containing protein [Actinomycetota bacterium]
MPGVVGPQEDTGWFATNLQHLSDMVLVISADTTIVWGNEAIEHTMGWRHDEFVGRSFAEFLHPDDLERASEVAALVGQEVFVEDSVRPALYRIRNRDGEWVHLELNSSKGPTPDGHLIVVCRFTGDLVYSTQLLEAVTRGASVEEQVAATLDLGRWRYPQQGYVIVHRVDHGYTAVAGPGVPPDLVGPDSPLGDLPWRKALEVGATLEVDDLVDGMDRSHLISDELVAVATAAGFAGFLAVPIPDDGYAEDAAIVVWSRRAGSALAGHRYAIETMAQALTLVFQQRAHRLKLERAAFTDQLTGLPSRRRFLTLLAEADAERPAGSGPVALYIDLDDFKSVNDRYGHGIGDHVLAAAAGRVAAALPPGTIVGRLGGDEFGILCAAGTTAAEAHALTSRIADALARPIAHEQGRVVVGATIGLHVGDGAQSALVALDLADQSLLVAKADRKDPTVGA